MKKIFIITGEYSGDIHGGRVLECLKNSSSDIQVEAIGGENLAKAGAKLYCDHSKMSGFGFNFKMALDHLQLEKKLSDYLINEYKPDLVLLIDYGTFNLRVARRLKNSNPNIKIFHYIPPQVWASRKWRIKGIKKYVDKVLCIFPFEVEMYKEYGIDVHYCGHPLVAQLPSKANKEEFLAVFTDKGTGKRVRLNDFEKTSRARRGLLTIREVKTNPYTIIKAMFVHNKDRIGIKNGDLAILKPTELVIADRYSTGSTIHKKGITDVYLVPTLEETMEEEEVIPKKDQISLEEVDARLMTIDDFLK